MAPPLVEIDAVRVSYGDLLALDGISCTIEPGAVGLLGPNGAGKSTLIRMLLGFKRPDAGTVRVFGLALPRHALAVRQKIGYMPERDVTSPQVSAVSFLSYCGQLVGMRHVDAMERAHEVLNYVNLGESRYRKLETFSSGMLQRVKLAQALIHDPKLVLLDEPTNGLDPAGRIEMLDLIRDLAERRGVAVLLSSHLLPDVQHVCERVIMIRGGRVVHSGPIHALLEQHEDLVAVRVRDRREAFEAALAAAGLHYRTQQGGMVLVEAQGAGRADRLFRIARGAGTQVRHYEPVRRTLEEAFLQAVEHE
ncbi:MAG: ABC transporter ATP-binding protein [Candidatus Hydrogenedentota bacterium]